MSQPIYNVLFLCTDNAGRSIMAEALLNSLGSGKFNAFSAGSHPSGQVNPYALYELERNNLSIDNFRSKSWLEFTQPDAPVFDFVFTVCDKAAGEICPVWPGQPITTHWGIEEPSAVTGSDIEKKKAFASAFRLLQRRISLFTCLPIDKLDAMLLKNELHAIGQVNVE